MAKSASPANEALAKKLERLEKEMKAVRAQLLPRSVSEALLSPRQPLWLVIKERLQRMGGAEDLETLVRGLLDEGHYLGKYPRRSVKQAVRSPHVRAIFHCEKKEDRKKGIDVETIKLTGKTAAYMPPVLRDAYAASID